MGARRLNKVKLEWSEPFSYAIGLITTDGNLSKDGRHIDLTSKDIDQLENFKKCLCIENKIGKKSSGFAQKRSYRLQLGDVNFYKFLLAIGLMPNKSKKLEVLLIPDDFFPDFLKGCIDGDGSIDVHSHKESRRPQLKLRLCSASPFFLKWVYQKIKQLINPKGGWIRNAGTVHILEYGKADAIKILNAMYHPLFKHCLYRKHMIAKDFLD